MEVDVVFWGYAWRVLLQSTSFPHVLGLALLAFCVSVLHYRHRSREEVYTRKTIRRTLSLTLLVAASAPVSLVFVTGASAEDIVTGSDVTFLATAFGLSLVSSWFALLPVLNLFETDRKPVDERAIARRVDSMRNIRR